MRAECAHSNHVNFSIGKNTNLYMHVSTLAYIYMSILDIHMYAYPGSNCEVFCSFFMKLIKYRTNNEHVTNVMYPFMNVVTFFNLLI